jgi:hypothetical protein
MGMLSSPEAEIGTSEMNRDAVTKTAKRIVAILIC